MFSKFAFFRCFIFLFYATIITSYDHNGRLSVARRNIRSEDKLPTKELPKPFSSSIFETLEVNGNNVHKTSRNQRSHQLSIIDIAIQIAARQGLNAMTELYGRIEPNILKNGQILDDNHPAALLSKFSAPMEDSEIKEMAAFATISATKAFNQNYKTFNELGRQAHAHSISLRRTALESLCAPRDPPACMPASERYRTHDGTCNNKRHLRWGAAQMPFNRFLPPKYGDGVDTVRESVEGGQLSSARFVSLLVHGAKDGEAPLTLMTAQWGQLLDHDMTSTAQPRSINGSVPSCCGSNDFHPSCFPIKVPLDDPWLAPLKVRCLEFLRSAPAQRRDCVLSWREQTNQATSYIDASPIYSNSARLSDNARVFRNGLLIFGRGNPAEDVCQKGALATQCIRAGDGRSSEQPGLLALHHVWVSEHNRIAMELSQMNQHWSDEKIYQETRRIIGAMFQHITYREFLPVILGKEVCKLFDLDLRASGYYEGYDKKTNPTIANSFAAAAFRFGHSLVQNSYIRCDRHHNILRNNVSLHEEFQRGDIGSSGSLHRLIRGMATQRVLKRDEFITPELTNHLFQTPGFPFGLDLAAINIQRGRDHGIPSYTSWRVPCGLTPVNSWEDFANVVGPESSKRIAHAYRSVHDIDLFVGGIAERPVVGGLVGPTFACIIAQQFSNLRKGDRFWYENNDFESSFTPAQLHSIRRISLAQVLCRVVGGGTFQPHIFMPADLPGNERMPCGLGPLAPIDLSPWLEKDPFVETIEEAAIETQIPDRVFGILPTDISATSDVQIIKENKAGFSNRLKPLKTTSVPETVISHVDLIPNATNGFQKPRNHTKVHDKLDIKRIRPILNGSTQKPAIGVHNKLDKGSNIVVQIKGLNRKRLPTTTKRTVVINNLPIELRSESLEQRNHINTKSNVIPQEKSKHISKKNLDHSTTKSDRAELRSNSVESDLNISTNIINDGKGNPTFTKDEELDNLENPTMHTNLSDNFVKNEDTTTIVEKYIEENVKLNNIETDAEENNREKLKANKNIRLKTDQRHHQEKRPLNEFVERSYYTKNILSPNTTELTDTQKLGNQKNPNQNTRLSRKTRNAKKSSKVKLPASIQPITNKVISRLANESMIDASTNNSAFRSVKTSTTVKVAKVTTTTPRGVELRQYEPISSRPIYTRPHKVVVDGPNADQYEIEINIRQTNKNPSYNPTQSFIPSTTVYKPNGYNSYPSSFGGYISTTPAYGFFQPTISGTYVQTQKTKPPTIIYINEHDEYTTTRPGILQNFINFATSSINGSKKPYHQHTTQKEKPYYEYGNQQFGSAHYLQRPPLGTVHASSTALSAGNFGSISGLASSNGADSTFSINIRPRPGSAQVSLEAGRPAFGYTVIPQRNPSFSTHFSPTEYFNQISHATSESEEVFYELPDRHILPISPFSTHQKRPLHHHFHSHTENQMQQKEVTSNVLPTPANHKLDVNDYDYLSKSLEPATNTSRLDEIHVNYEDEDDDEDYDENVTQAKKFDRDGYLRPEHVGGTLFSIRNDTAQDRKFENLTKADNTNSFQNKLKKFSSTLQSVKENRTQNAPNIFDSSGKSSTKDVPALEYKEDTNEPLLLSKTELISAMSQLAKQRRRQHENSNIAFAPLQVLTKLERPDNWIMFDTPEEKPLLPELPEIFADSEMASEVPRPIKDFSSEQKELFDMVPSS